MRGAEELTLAIVVGVAMLAMLLLSLGFRHDMKRRRSPRAGALFLEEPMGAPGDAARAPSEHRTVYRTSAGRRVAWRKHGPRLGGHRDSYANAGVLPNLFVGGSDDGGGANCSSDGGGGGYCDSGGGS